ncbi:hypothetical protein K2173_028253 [Erythroxylum novogranatense]|uniref:Fatty acid hydroxylase domain-containing protein n=1 Tax=Erythroxylum novogranatense TaxID=1862640 RepID=A0AAV8U1C2_9ROSI|nr:hypothetical protein K2173_028253 [Erythroxylum novogranatense]
MLPYHSMQQAETALGRELSVAEKLWFSYSANKSDFILDFHNFLFFFFFYSLFSLPYILIDLIEWKKLTKYKIQPRIKISFSGMLRCYKDVVVSSFLVFGPLQLFSYDILKWFGIRTSLPLPCGWEVLSQILIYFLIEDYVGYWLHRWLHTKWAYEKIHHVHHEYIAPIGPAAPYAHWAETLILGFPSFIGPALVPGHIVTFWVWFALRLMEAIDAHSGYEFPWSPAKFVPLFGGAEYHDYHHYVGGKSQSNFASVFTYCDYIYGTNKGYRYQKLISRKDLKRGVKWNYNHLHGSSVKQFLESY